MRRIIVIFLTLILVFVFVSCDENRVLNNPNDQNTKSYSPPSTFVLATPTAAQAKRDTLRYAVGDTAQILARGQDTVAHDSISSISYFGADSQSIRDTVVHTHGHDTARLSVPVKRMGNFDVLAIARDTTGAWSRDTAIAFVKTYRCHGVCFDSSVKFKDGDTLQDTTLALRWYAPLYDSLVKAFVDSHLVRTTTDTATTFGGADGIAWNRSTYAPHNLKLVAYSRKDQKTDILKKSFFVIPDPGFDSMPKSLWVKTNTDSARLIPVDGSKVSLDSLASRNLEVFAALKTSQSYNVLNGVLDSAGAFAYQVNGQRDTIHVVVFSANKQAAKSYSVPVSIRGVDQRTMLSALFADTVSGRYGILSRLTPVFDASLGSYTLTIPKGDSALLSWRKYAPNAKVNCSNSMATDSSLVVHSVPSDGSIKLQVNVPTNSLIGKNTYAVNVVAGPAHDPRLSSLGLSAGTLSPVFSMDSSSYTLILPTDSDAVVFNPVTFRGAKSITLASDKDAVDGLVLKLPRHDTAKATVSDLATITSTSERGDCVSVYGVRVQRGIYKTDSTLKSVFADSGFVEWDGRASSPIVVKTW